MFKKVITLCLVLSWTVFAFAQSQQNLTNLAYLNATTKTKKAYDFSPPEAGEFDDYGGKIGVGITILDGFGVPVRYYFNPKHVVELGLYSSGVVLTVENSSGEFVYDSYYPEVKIGGGYTYFGSRFLKTKQKRNKTKEKVRAHGVAVRYNQIFGDFSRSQPSVGWAMETFKKDRTNRSFIFELGLQATFKNFSIPPNQRALLSNGLYLRCHWNFFLK